MTTRAKTHGARLWASETTRKNPLNNSRKFQQLATDVEELLARLDDEHSPQLDKLRDRVEATISEVKSTLSNQGKSTTAQVRRYAGIANDYITGYPRAAFASGILIGAALGFLIASARSRD
jgi:ElaB/YqjD/DUF883 family membrane-anchored ribosome-binding protein